MRIDPHVHLPIEQEAMLRALWQFVKNGVEAIVVTYPGSAEPAWTAERLVSQFNIPIIIVPGAEMMSSEGDIISAIGAVRDGIIYSGMPAESIIDDIHRYGGLAVLCHSQRVLPHLKKADAVQGMTPCPRHMHNFGEGEFTINITGKTDREIIAALRNGPPVESCCRFDDKVEHKHTYVKGKVAVVIPVYNCPDFLQNAVDSLKTTDWPDMEVILVDNHSTDQNTVNMLSQYSQEGHMVIWRNNNDGFSHAVNEGCRATEAEVVVLFNQDAEVIDPTWLGHMMEMFHANPECGVQGAKLLYPKSHVIQHIGITFLSHPMGNSGHHHNMGHPADIPAANISRQIGAVTGAVFGIRHDVFDALGGLSEDYTMGCEDSDFCFQVWTKLGMQVWYNSKVVCSHFDNGIKKRTPGSREMALRSGWGFYSKWHYWLRTLPEQNENTKIVFVVGKGDPRLTEVHELVSRMADRGYKVTLSTPAALESDENTILVEVGDIALVTVQAKAKIAFKSFQSPKSFCTPGMWVNIWIEYLIGECQ